MTTNARDDLACCGYGEVTQWGRVEVGTEAHR